MTMGSLDWKQMSPASGLKPVLMCFEYPGFKKKWNWSPVFTDWEVLVTHVDSICSWELRPWNQAHVCAWHGSEELVTECFQLRPVSPVCLSSQGTFKSSVGSHLSLSSRLFFHPAFFALLQGFHVHLRSLTLILSDQDVMCLKVCYPCKNSGWGVLLSKRHRWCSDQDTSKRKHVFKWSA